jgi:hypothetical protein
MFSRGSNFSSYTNNSYVREQKHSFQLGKSKPLASAQRTAKTILSTLILKLTNTLAKRGAD